MTDMTKPEPFDLRSHTLPDEKRRELLRLFPEIATEGGKLDFDRLKLALGEAVDVGRERYGMNWPGKADCFRTIQAPSMGTLRPAPEESVNFDTTENLIIEGDNLEVLKLLQKSYLGKVKLIYIDPPYNTGNDFIYPDNYTESLQTYLEYTGQVDAQGRKFGSNLETDGRFHSRWLNMMYPRLYLARNLLREDGVVFISINDVEVAKLRCICDEVFGEDCLVAQFVWNNEGNIDNQSKVKVAHEYIVCYSRSPDGFVRPSVIDPNVEESSKLYNTQIENSITKNGPANPPSVVTLPVGFPATTEAFVVEPREDKWPKVRDRIVVEKGRLMKAARVESGWSSRNLLDLFIGNGCVPILDAEGKETWFAMTPTGAVYGFKKRAEAQGHVLSVIRNVGTTKQNSGMLAAWGIDFPYPKPLRLIQYIIEVATAQDPEAMVMDFFPGSGTTAHAVLTANSRDRGRRTYCLVQLPERIAEGTLNCDNGFRTIADLTKERVRRVVEQLNQEDSERLAPEAGTKPDRGFRVFKLAESNFTPWDTEAPKDAPGLGQQLEMHVRHIRQGRTEQDLLYEILLKDGFPPTTPVEQVTLAGKRVFRAAGGSFLISLERELTLELIRALAKEKPERVVLLDEGFAGNDQLKANAVKLFENRGVTRFRTV